MSKPQWSHTAAPKKQSFFPNEPGGFCTPGMVVEHFKHGNAAPVYRRFRERDNPFNHTGK
ncbi:MAG: hypothetical protein HS126_22870 [Anaerolineales bacterium]|nr:hypothetical protein [Anaerolineales bacterium]